MIIKTFPLGPLQTNAYVLVNNGEAIVIDPGGDATAVMDFVKNEGAKIVAILNTHLHFDHTLGNKALAEATGVRIHASAEDKPLLDTELGAGGMMGLPKVPAFEFDELAEGETEFCGLKCAVFATPGHSNGSLTFHFPEAKAAFVGDLIFYRSIGRTDFPGGSMDVLSASVREKIFTLPDDTVIYPGHGPETSVGDEKNHNPFFTQF